MIAGTAAFPLTFIRFLGPMWVVLIVGAVVVTIGWRRTQVIARRHLRVVAVVAGTTLLGVCWWALWQVIASHASGVDSGYEVKRWILAFNLPAYLMQMVGAFPYRNNPAPLGIYPLVFFVIVLLLVAAWRRGPTLQARRAVFWITVTTLAVPVILSLVFMPSLGAIWQGRYVLPFAIGVLPLCGLFLDEADFAPVEGKRLVGLCGVFLAISNVVCVYHVEQWALQQPESAHDPAWWHPPGYVIGALMLVACGVAWQLTRVRHLSNAGVDGVPLPSRAHPERAR
jgi:hypothetical protein